MGGINRRVALLRGPIGDAPTLVTGSTTQVGPDEPASFRLRKTGNSEYTAEATIPQGQIGLPGVNAVENDTAVAEYIRRDDTASRVSVNSAIREQASLPPLPLAHVERAPRDGAPVPITEFSGYLWGGNGNTIYRSQDDGRTWAEYASVPSEYGTTTQAIVGIIPTHDGEALVFSQTHVGRSTGWDTGAPTWETVLTNPTASVFHPWGVDGDGTKFVVTHYSGSGVSTPDRVASRYGWISIDGGKTFEVKWDSAELFSPSLNERSHIHAVAYDAWEDRFFIAEGHEEASGVYVSYDDGNTWDRVPYDGFEVVNSPTVIRPTDHGVVFGSDASGPNGVYVMPRGTNQIRSAWVWEGIQNSRLLGYAHMGYRDKRTGIVYLVFELNPSAQANGFTTYIAASDGRTAGAVWKADPTERLWRRVVITPGGNLVAYDQATDIMLYAKPSGAGITDITLQDTGRILGGQAQGSAQTVAVGKDALAIGDRSIAIGDSTADGADGVAIGNAESSGSSVAIGSRATTSPNGVAVGPRSHGESSTAIGTDAVSSHAQSTAIGRNAKVESDTGTPVPRSTAVGSYSKAQRLDSTAIGALAEALGTRSTAIGSGSVTQTAESLAIGPNTSTHSGTRNVAIGTSAEASHTNSIAIGYDARTTGHNQMALGERHLEGQAMDDPVAPAEGAGRLYFRTNSEGKEELVVRFNTGGPIVIATQP